MTLLEVGTSMVWWVVESWSEQHSTLLCRRQPAPLLKCPVILGLSVEERRHWDWCNLRKQSLWRPLRSAPELFSWAIGGQWTAGKGNLFTLWLKYTPAKPIVLKWVSPVVTVVSCRVGFQTYFVPTHVPNCALCQARLVATGGLPLSHLAPFGVLSDDVTCLVMDVMVIRCDQMWSVIPKNPHVIQGPSHHWLKHVETTGVWGILSTVRRIPRILTIFWPISNRRCDCSILLADCADPHVKPRITVAPRDLPWAR